jgi:hypothetical protein
MRHPRSPPVRWAGFPAAAGFLDFRPPDRRASCQTRSYREPIARSWRVRVPRLSPFRDRHVAGQADPRYRSRVLPRLTRRPNNPGNEGRQARESRPSAGVNHPDPRAIPANRSYCEPTVRSWRVWVRSSPQPSTIYSRTRQARESRPSAGAQLTPVDAHSRQPAHTASRSGDLCESGSLDFRHFADPSHCRAARCVPGHPASRPSFPRLCGRRVDQARCKICIEDWPDLRRTGSKMANAEKPCGVAKSLANSPAAIAVPARGTMAR